MKCGMMEGDIEPCVANAGCGEVNLMYRKGVRAGAGMRPCPTGG